MVGVAGTILAGFVKRVATSYTITDRRLHIKRGIVSRTIQETRLERVQNVNYTQSVVQRMLQVGDVDFDTAAGDDYNFVFAASPSPPTSSTWSTRPLTASAPRASATPRRRSRRRAEIGAGRRGGALADPGGLAQRVGAVGALPGEVVVVAAEVAVGGGLLVDRPVQVQLACGTMPGRRSKCSCDQLRDLGVGILLGAEGLDHQRDRVGDADRVGDLDLAAVGEPGGDHVLGHVARHVGGRAVDLRGVLAGEGAAAVAGHAAVGVDDDLAAGQAGVADRARRSRTARWG